MSFFIFFIFYVLGVAIFVLLFKFKVLPILIARGTYPGAYAPYEPVNGVTQVVHRESLFLTTDDQVKIHAQFTATRSEKGSKNVPSLLYLHGNRSNLSIDMPNYKTLSDHFNILAVEYRCYGLSDKKSPCSEQGLILDAKAGLEHLFTRHDIDINRVYIYGRSLGTAVAIGLLSDVVFANRILYPICGVVLENAFTSVNDVINESLLTKNAFENSVDQFHVAVIPYRIKRVCGKFVWPFVWFVKQFMIPSFWHSLERTSLLIPSKDFGMLFLVGEADTLIPPLHSRRLFESSRVIGANKSLVAFPNGTHRTTCRQPTYCQELIDFVNNGSAIHTE